MTRDWSVCRDCHAGYHSDCHEPQCNCQIHLAPVAMENLGKAIQLIKASQGEIARGIREGGDRGKQVNESLSRAMQLLLAGVHSSDLELTDN